MENISTIEHMRSLSASWRKEGKTVVLVPTMGALHRGHGRLISRALQLGDIVVVSSFLNPMQFNNKSDLVNYPRTEEADRAVCEKLGVHYFFNPTHGDIYPSGFLTYVKVSHLSDMVEGASRPGHFRGVTTIVAKLFNIVQPSKAVFGHKDAQQLMIIRHMVRDLCFPVEIVAVPTERDKSGLALSSRNALLTPEQKLKSLCLVRGIKRVHFLVKTQNITHCGELLQALRSAVNSAGDGVELDYVRIVSRLSLEDLAYIERGNTLILMAAVVDGVRMIDSSRL
ncbi:MAG: pantoate--beta-alanine ligase [Sumerlaeia bacterium]